MKLYTFEAQGRQRLGAKQGVVLIDLAAAYKIWRATFKAPPEALGELPSEMVAFLGLGEPALKAAREAIAFMAKRPVVPVGERLEYSLDEVYILTPVLRPGKIVCLEWNYKSQAAELPDGRLPQEPLFYAKWPSSIIGPGVALRLPKVSKRVDYGIQLAVVIGKRMKRVAEADALAYVAGYTILNDITARDVQLDSNQLTLAKNCDTFCPIGPCVATVDQILDPSDLKLRLLVNSQVLQETSTRDLAISIPTLLSKLSQVISLDPGDIVGTGTPSGTALFRQTPSFLKAGDSLQLEIDAIGILENPVSMRVVKKVEPEEEED